jgi:polyhydroxybutyrate depolymerase
LRPAILSLLVVAMLCAACGGAPEAGQESSTTGSATTATPSTTTTLTSTTSTTAPTTTTTIVLGSELDFVAGGDRPVTVHVPPGYDPEVPAPLLIMLHGYMWSGAEEEAYLRLGPAAMAHSIIYAYPNGTPERGGQRFWNATGACCNYSGSPVDDSAYLADLVDEIGQVVNVDPKRVFFVGHSNGGFMSYRMACDHADLIAGIGSLAGSTYAVPSDCRPTEPVAVLQIHGTADSVIRYAGGSAGMDLYPGARATAAIWADYDGCDGSIDSSQPNIDVDRGIEGETGPEEATVEAYSSGCAPGGYVELWTVHGGGHVPELSDTFAEDVITFLLEHPKP